MSEEAEVQGEEFWKAEAEAVIRDIGCCVESVTVSSTYPSSNTGIYFNITTLEGMELCVELIAGGFRVVGHRHDQTHGSQRRARLYETPYALLNEISPAFRTRFAQLLINKMTETVEKTNSEEAERN